MLIFIPMRKCVFVNTKQYVFNHLLMFGIATYVILSINIHLPASDIEFVLPSIPYISLLAYTRTGVLRYFTLLKCPGFVLYKKRGVAR